MPSYCLKCKKNTENIDTVVSKTINGRAILLSKYAICNSKNQDLLKNKKRKDL